MALTRGDLDLFGKVCGLIFALLISPAAHATVPVGSTRREFLAEEFAIDACVEQLEGGVPRMLEENLFEVQRSLRQYRDHLGAGFWRVLKSLRADQVWLDSGAGATVALGEFLTGVKLSPNDRRPLPVLFDKPRPKCVGLVYRLPKAGHDIQAIVARNGMGSHLQLLQDEKLEDIDPKKLGSPFLTTDLMGPASYTDRLDLVMDKYLGITPVGGHIIILTATLHTTVETVADGKLSLSRYFDKYLKGHNYAFDFAHNTDPNLFHIQVTADGPRRLPHRLKPKKPIEAGQPPIRQFIEDLTPGQG